ncbi:MAG TPA: hypothetical protein VMI75_36005 [Polyangiaceae bacterium]|nr:hypothetical protein [Polyangiaceae bacterium]
MLRALLKAAVLGAAFASVACGGDAFSAGSGGEDGGTSHDSSSPPGDGGSGNDAPTPDSSPVDAFSEPPPSCSGAFGCVPDVPAGWQGPMEVYAGAAAPPACMVNFAQSVGANDVLQAPAATCGCSCGQSTTTCKPPMMTFSDSMTCTTAGGSCATSTLTPNVCQTLDERSQCATAVTLDMSLLAGTSVMGSCTAAPMRDVPPYSWGIQARGCVSTVAAAQVDCGSGKICAPAPEPGFAQKLCISHAGDVACPGNGYGVKHLYYTSVDDTRTCSDCTCGMPTGGSCSFSVVGYSSSDQSCTGNAVTYLPGTKCAGVQQPGDFRLTLAPTNGSCTASTSSASGTATPTGPVTVCCPL